MRKTTNVWNLPAGVPCAVAVCLSAFVVSSCTHMPGSEPIDPLTDEVVKIVFDPAGCPKSATPENFEVDKSKRVAWQSVNAAGGNIEMVYQIYFDPFKGQPLKTKSGTLRSTPFDRESPPAEYKYTIVGTECKNSPLDPRFRLR